MSEFIELSDKTQDIFVEDALKFFANPLNCQKYPRLASVFIYWQGQRDNKFAPYKKDFSLSDLPVESIPYCMIAEVEPTGPEFVYRFWGTKCVDITKQELTGKNVKAVEPEAVADENYQSYCLAYAKKSPLIFAKTFAKTFFLDSEDLFLRVPLTENGAECEYILTIFEHPSGPMDDIEKKFEEAVKNRSANSNEFDLEVLASGAP
jgi:hypothetical protein